MLHDQTLTHGLIPCSVASFELHMNTNKTVIRGYRTATVPLPYRYRTITVPLPYRYGVTVPYCIVQYSWHRVVKY